VDFLDLDLPFCCGVFGGEYSSQDTTSVSKLRRYESFWHLSAPTMLGIGPATAIVAEKVM
jgi:hypothetical protein